MLFKVAIGIEIILFCNSSQKILFCTFYSLLVFPLRVPMSNITSEMDYMITYPIPRIQIKQTPLEHKPDRNARFAVTFS